MEIFHYCNAFLCKNGEQEDDEHYVNPMSELLLQVFNQLEK